jgi:hypothetical protein
MKKLKLKIVKFFLKQEIEFFVFENSIVFKSENKKICVIEIRNSDFMLFNNDAELDFRELKKFVKNII